MPAISRLALILLLSLPACSYLFVTPPHEGYGGQFNRDCTTNRAAPVIDTILVATNTVSAVYVAGKENVKNQEAAVSLGVAFAAFWLSSAIYGYYNTSRCSELVEDEGPYSRPVPHFVPPLPRPTWQPMPPATPPAPPAAGAGQSDDEEDPSHRSGPPPGDLHRGSTGRPDLTPRYGN